MPIDGKKITLPLIKQCLHGSAGSDLSCVLGGWSGLDAAIHTAAFVEPANGGWRKAR